MPTWSVSTRGVPAIQIGAPNWIAALGIGLEGLGRAAHIERLAAEVLPNGTVIARDITTGTGFVVQPVEPDDEAEPYTDEFTTIAPEDLQEVVPERTADDAARFEPITLSETPVAAGQIALLLARDLVPAESGAVILEERGYLRFVSVLGPHARKLAGVRLPLGTGVAGFVMQHRRTLVLDAQEDPRHCREIDELTGYVTREIVVVPLVDGDQCFGVIELLNPPPERRFTPSEVEALQAVGRALAQRLARD